MRNIHTKDHSACLIQPSHGIVSILRVVIKDVINTSHFHVQLERDVGIILNTVLAELSGMNAD